MMSDNKTTNVGQMSDIKEDILTLSEASAYAKVSTKTIERHATYTKYQPVSIIRNNRKTKGYSKEWLDNQYTNVGHLSDKKQTSQTFVRQVSDMGKIIENKEIKEVSLINELKQDVTFLRKEIEVKNEQIQAKDSQIIELISSEQKTKMLLADLQLQQKNILLDKPSAKQWEKKSSKIWWALFMLLVAVCGVACYYGIEFIKELIIKIKF